MESEQSSGSLLTDSTLSTILRHDSKQTSYKIALLRAINDVVLAFPDLSRQSRPVAVPLRILAGFWAAYYWPFVSPTNPIFQGPRANRDGKERNDLSFRPTLARLRHQWEIQLLQATTTGGAADGFVLSGELRLPRKRAEYPQELLTAYEEAIKAIMDALRQPIQYAGNGQWQVFDKPKLYKQLIGEATPIPGTRPEDSCLVISHSLWETFSALSLWVEALCIHEWCLFTEGVDQGAGIRLDRGDVYRLLTQHPESRRPLTWERNRVDLLLLEGQEFTCPWSLKKIRGKSAHYDLDHIVPLSVYPINELWNLVPSDPHTNSHLKRARLPSPERIEKAQPYLIAAYLAYATSSDLGPALNADVTARFLSEGQTGTLPSKLDATRVAQQTMLFVKHLGSHRNLALF